MTTRIYVPNDTTACSVGADAVAEAIEATLARIAFDATIVRNGSRGAYALEPLVEIDADDGRIGFPLGGDDAQFTLEAAYCFGNCACGPTVRIDDAIHGRVSAERFDALIDALRADAARP